MGVLLFIFAFLVRLISLLTSGGFDSVLGYDDGVYYGAATAFSHGLIPYKDFVMVHPPGILLILSPFTWLANITSDATGFYFARVFFMLIGACSTYLIYRIGRRFSRTAGIIAALIYAVWMPIVRLERTPYLEGIGSLALLIALHLLPKASVNKNRIALAGVVLGFAVSTKLWFAVPVVIISIWLIFSKEFKRAFIFGASSLATFGVVISWFWLKAGSKFWDLILVAQVNRHTSYISPLTRIEQIFNFVSFTFIHDNKHRFIFGSILVILIGFIFLKYFKSRDQGLLILMLFAAQFLILMQTPVFFNAYPSFVAATFALIAGIALGKFHRNLISGILTLVLVISGAHSSFTQAPGRDLPTKVEQLKFKNYKCVTSDDPVVLAMTNTLSQDLKNKCHLIFDVTGTIYGIDGGANPNRVSATVRRLDSATYQSIVEKYLAEGSIVILARRTHDGLLPATIFQLDKRRTVTKSGSFVIIS